MVLCDHIPRLRCRRGHSSGKVKSQGRGRCGAVRGVGTRPVAEEAGVEEIEHDHVAPLGPHVPPALQERGVALDDGHDLGQAVGRHCPPRDGGDPFVDLRGHNAAG